MPNILIISLVANIILFLILQVLLFRKIRVTDIQRGKLQESEEKWRRLFNILPVGVSIFDSNYKISEINPALEKITGITSEGLRQGLYKKRKYLKIDGTPMSQDDFPSARAIREQKEILHVQIGIVKEDESIIWTDVSAAPLPFQDSTCVIVTADITKRIETEEALRMSEERFRLFINSSPLGILLTKPNGEILSANPACCKIFQMTEEEICRGGRAAIIDVTDPRLAAGLKEREERGEIHAKGLTMIRKNGEKFEAEVSSVIFQDAQGIKLTSMILDDITKRKEMEDRLQENEERLRRIIELMHEGVSVTDESGKLIHWNHFTENVTGIKTSDAVGKYIWEIQNQMVDKNLKSPQSYENLKQGLLDFLKTGQAVWANKEMERAYSHPNGSKLILLGRVSSIPTQKGFMLVATQQDITERKKMEDALRFSENRFRTLIENLQVGVVLQGPGSEVLLCNPKASELLGLSENQLVGKTSVDPYWNIIHEDGSPLPAPDRPVQQALELKKPVRGVTMGVYRPSKNDRIWLLASADPQLDDTGNVKQVITTFIDITERYEMEKKIRQLADYDQLTQLPNRRLLDDRLGQAMAESKRSHRYGAVIFLDLDNFKPLNDKYGHAVGDLLLKNVAVRLLNCVRESDTVARFGGDEFVVILKELDKDELRSLNEVRVIAEKILNTFSEAYVLKIITGDDTGLTIEHHCGASVGAALFLDHGATREDIIKWADLAMYKSKEAGRNRITFYSPELEK